MSESSELQRAVENLTRSIERLESTLVRKDVYESDQRGVSNELSALKAGVAGVAATVDKIEERRAADRRLLFAAFIAPFALLLLQLYLTAQTGGAA